MHVCNTCIHFEFIFCAKLFAVGGADQALTGVQITTLFNLSASHVATQRLYNSGLILPSKLSWVDAKALLAALLDGLTTHDGEGLEHGLPRRRDAAAPATAAARRDRSG